MTLEETPMVRERKSHTQVAMQCRGTGGRTRCRSCQGQKDGTADSIRGSGKGYEGALR